jgi:hypothetical protein
MQGCVAKNVIYAGAADALCVPAFAFSVLSGRLFLPVSRNKRPEKRRIWASNGLLSKKSLKNGLFLI